MLKQEKIILPQIKTMKWCRNIIQLQIMQRSNTSNVTYKYNNLLNQEFNNYKLHEIGVSDLTQVVIRSKW